MTGNRAGYRRPPKQSQFKKGESGNPKGRRKRTLDVKASMERVLTSTAEVRIRGKLKRIPISEAIVRRLITAALKGDVRAAAQILTLRSHARRNYDVGPMIITITGGIPGGFPDNEFLSENAPAPNDA